MSASKAAMSGLQERLCVRYHFTRAKFSSVVYGISAMAAIGFTGRRSDA